MNESIPYEGNQESLQKMIFPHLPEQNVDRTPFEDHSEQTLSGETPAGVEAYMSETVTETATGEASQNLTTDLSQTIGEEKSPSWLSWLNRHKVKLAIGAIVVGTLFSPIGETVDELKHNAPWITGAALATEIGWLGGAAMMLAAAGKKIGNPFKLRSRWNEIKENPVDTALFKSGLYVNGASALALAGVVIGGSVTTLPAEAWPAPMALAAVDIAGTIAFRKPIVSKLHELEATKTVNAEAKEKQKFKIRHATLADIPRLAELDISLFKGSYGEAIPQKEEVEAMFTKRFQNCPDWMFVVDINGTPEGFVSAFRTNKPLEDFKSWEDTTANGTLDGKVASDGKYVYVTNLTMGPKAMKAGAFDSALANLMANAVRDGVEYAYFESRIPMFKRWVRKQIKNGEISEEQTDEQLFELAKKYSQLTRETKTGDVRHDPLLAMYEKAGAKLMHVVPDAFSDEASMNFGVVCKAEIPPVNRHIKRIKPLRVAMAGLLRAVAQKPGMLEKVM